MDLQKTYNRIFIISTIIICFSSLNSCYKPDPTIAIIRVLDNNTNNPIENISVRLFFDDSNGANIPKYDIVKNTLSNGTAMLFIVKSNTIILSQPATL